MNTISVRKPVEQNSCLNSVAANQTLTTTEEKQPTSANSVAKLSAAGSQKFQTPSVYFAIQNVLARGYKNQKNSRQSRTLDIIKSNFRVTTATKRSLARHLKTGGVARFARSGAKMRHTPTTFPATETPTGNTGNPIHTDTGQTGSKHEPRFLNATGTSAPSAASRTMRTSSRIRAGLKSTISNPSQSSRRQRKRIGQKTSSHCVHAVTGG